MLKNISVIVLTMCAAVIIAACGDNQRTASNINTGATPQAANSNTRHAPAPPVATATPRDGVRRISVAELQSALEKGEAVVVDVRGEESYAASHIKGARLFPDDQIARRANELPRDKLIVTYCA